MIEFTYELGFIDYLRSFNRLNDSALLIYDELKNGLLPLNNTDVSKACLIKIIKDVPLDGDLDKDIKPVKIIDLSYNKTVNVDVLKALLSEIEASGKGQSIISIDVRHTNITEDEAKELMDTEPMLNRYEMFGITLIYDS